MQNIQTRPAQSAARLDDLHRKVSDCKLCHHHLVLSDSHTVHDIQQTGPLRPLAKDEVRTLSLLVIAAMQLQRGSLTSRASVRDIVQKRCRLAEVETDCAEGPAGRRRDEQNPMTMMRPSFERAVTGTLGFLVNAEMTSSDPFRRESIGVAAIGVLCVGKRRAEDERLVPS